MKNSNKQKFGLIIIVNVMMSCNYNLNPKENRIFVVEEKKINDSKTFFWFRESGQITHEGVSYFQITDDKCKLSVKAADAYCNDPVQICDIENDTVFVLSMSEIISLKKNEDVKIKKVQYAIEFYEASKKPDRDKQYFLDSVCGK
jgi:hypothetical protein